MDLTLYSFDGCPFAHRIRILLELKKVKFELINIDLQNKPDWFLKINPLGKVPVIKHGEKIINESAVIAEYIDEAFEGPKVMPETAFIRAKCRIAIANSGPHLMAVYKMKKAESDEEREAARAGVIKSVEELGECIQGKFFLGDEISMADVTYGPILERAVMFMKQGVVTLPETEGVKKALAYHNNLLEQPAFAACKLSL
eukprot:TRINITY_DN4030_c0_g1_i1.p1 TRINITY_DN4030_c0_g1~~TRINITY_DN4030_c0_g1_i1.p1  ORF type:complete len:200 (+),score=68.86 TRINITY_DN4030_c0_g1_i1:64-663(+)